MARHGWSMPVRLVAELLDNRKLKYWVVDPDNGSGVSIICKLQDAAEIQHALRELQGVSVHRYPSKFQSIRSIFKPAEPAKLRLVSLNPDGGKASIVFTRPPVRGYCALTSKLEIATEFHVDFLRKHSGGLSTPIRVKNIISDKNLKIDVVYTWVDGSDPSWRRRKRKFKSNSGSAVTSDARATDRWKSWDELRYSLRSIEKFAPWVNRIFVVTDGQRPGWLIESDKLRVVDHREIFSKYVLHPTFNSHAIETQLARIPGLGEHFLYFNDDFILARPTPQQKFFFPNGTSVFYPSPALIPLGDVSSADNAANAAGKNLRRLISDGDYIPINKLKHVPYAMRKSLLLKLERKYHKEFVRTGARRFRSVDDISLCSQLYPYWAFLNCHAVPGQCRLHYYDVSSASPPSWWFWRFKLKSYDFICLNATDGIDNGNSNIRKLKKLLDAYFPKRSVFEKDE